MGRVNSLCCKEQGSERVLLSEETKSAANGITTLFFFLFLTGMVDEEREPKWPTEFHERHPEIISMKRRRFYAPKVIPGAQPHVLLRCPETNSNLKFTHDTRETVGSGMRNGSSRGARED